MSEILIFVDKVQILMSLYLLNKILGCIGIILLVEFSKYLECFIVRWSGETSRNSQFMKGFISASKAVKSIIGHFWHFAALQPVVHLVNGSAQTLYAIHSTP